MTLLAPSTPNHRNAHPVLVTIIKADLAARSAPTIDEIATTLGIEHHRAIEQAALVDHPPV